MDPNASDQVIIDMIAADADKDGKVDFEEFKKIMLYKPEEDYKLSDQAQTGPARARGRCTAAASEGACSPW